MIRLNQASSRDVQALADHVAPAISDALPEGLELLWLGTAGFSLRYETCTLLIDPFFSRPPLQHVVRRIPLTPNSNAFPPGIAECQAILIGHTHYDHALDAPAIARAGQCRLWGSRSLGHLCRLWEIADRWHLVEPDVPFDVGPFTITFVTSRHSPTLLGMGVLYGGEIDASDRGRMPASSFRSGDVWGIHVRVGDFTLYHLGSADLVESAYRLPPPSLFLAPLAGRGFSRDFVGRSLRTLQPKTIIPHHFDNFFQPIEPLSFSFNVNLADFIDEARQCAPQSQILCLRPLQVLKGSASTAGSHSS